MKYAFAEKINSEISKINSNLEYKNQILWNKHGSWETLQPYSIDPFR